MTISEISNKLQTLGYTVFFQESLNTLFCGIDKDSDIKLDTTLKISVEEDNIICIFFDRNVPEEVRFDKIPDLIVFIENKIPL